MCTSYDLNIRVFFVCGGPKNRYRFVPNIIRVTNEQFKCRSIMFLRIYAMHSILFVHNNGNKKLIIVVIQSKKKIYYHTCRINNVLSCLNITLSIQGRSIYRKKHE